MTDITLSSGDIIRPWKSPFGAHPIKDMKLSTGISSAIIYQGMVVGLDVNSTAFQDCIIPSSVTSNAIVSTAIVGVAADGFDNALHPSNTNNKAQGTVIPVWEANPLCEFRGRTGHGLLNSTMVGQVKGIFRDSTLNIDLIECGASSLATPANRVVITGLLDNSGDSGGAVTFRFITNDPNSSVSTSRCLAFFV